MVDRASTPVPAPAAEVAMAADAADATDVMVAFSVAVIDRLPVVVPIFADLAYASTTLVIELVALEMPTDTAAPK